MKTIMLVFGTRPEAIKMAPLVKEFQKNKDDFKTIVCVTGQHREMLDQVLKIFEITPDYDLNIMKQGQDLYDVTARVLTGMRDVFKECKPDVVLVHGDTTTSTAAALAAFYQQIPVGHVEAGLRTHNIYSPWPEEMNRQITGRIATYNFSPTPLSEQNLKDEKAHGQIFVTGNTVIDALHMVVDKLKEDPILAKEQEWVLAKAGYDVSRLENGKKLVLITGHRRENFGEGFINMVTAMKDLAEKYPDVDFVYPMHLNPNVRKPIHQVFTGMDSLSKGEGWGEAHNFFFIEPLQYLEFVYLMEKSTIVLTDSGGIQEEAPGLGKPVLVMRDTTERPEALESGTVHLVGTNHDLIVSEVSILLDDPVAYDIMSKAVNPYGDGKACGRIVDALRKGKIYLKRLSQEDSIEYYDMLQHIGHDENDFTNPVYGMNYEDYKKWLKQQDDWSKGEMLPEGYVPQFCYWLMVDDVPVGFGKIRLGLTPQSRIEGGNIGYAIDSRYRGKGYGTKLVELLIKKAREKKVTEFLITVKKYNYPSKIASEKNGCKVIKETDGWWYLTF